ncbi:hypothetical protein GPALN_004538 [Globodera pallida]|nr:hypothetical protein GPALN_004538 [Globodera pallida]
MPECKCGLCDDCRRSKRVRECPSQYHPDLSDSMRCREFRNHPDWLIDEDVLPVFFYGKCNCLNVESDECWRKSRVKELDAEKAIVKNRKGCHNHPEMVLLKKQAPEAYSQLLALLNARKTFSTVGMYHGSYDGARL